MRLSYLIASMLPLSALAAPSLVVRQSTPAVPSTAPSPSPSPSLSALDTARQEVVDGLTNAAKALNATILEAQTIKGPLQQTVIDDATRGLANITFAGAAVEQIGKSILAGTPPLESDQFHVAKGIILAQCVINKLDREVNIGKHNGGIGNGKRSKHNSKGNGNGKGNLKNGKGPLHDLRVNVGQAVEGIALALKGGTTVLQLQGKTIDQLFEDAGETRPPL